MRESQVRDAVFNIDRIDDRGSGKSRPPGPAAFQHRTIRLEQRVQLARRRTIPDLDHFDARALVDHVLERVREILLALVLAAGEHVIDAFVEQLPVPDVLEADVRALGDRRRRLLHDPRHVPVRVGHDDAEALIVVDLLRPDDSVGVARSMIERSASKIVSTKMISTG